MKKLIFLSLIVSGTALQARTNFELWNKSKKIFHVSFIDDKMRQLLKEGKKANTQYELEFVELAPGGRLTLDDANFDNSKPTSLLFADLQFVDSKKIDKDSWDWDPPVIFSFAPNRDLYVRVKDSVKSLSDIRDGGFGKQTGPWKGLKGKTETGLPLKNVIQPAEIKLVSQQQ